MHGFHCFWNPSLFPFLFSLSYYIRSLESLASDFYLHILSTRLPSPLWFGTNNFIFFFCPSLHTSKNEGRFYIYFPWKDLHGFPHINLCFSKIFESFGIKVPGGRRKKMQLARFWQKIPLVVSTPIRNTDLTNHYTCFQHLSDLVLVPQSPPFSWKLLSCLSKWPWLYWTTANLLGICKVTCEMSFYFLTKVLDW